MNDCHICGRVILHFGAKSRFPSCECCGEIDRLRAALEEIATSGQDRCILVDIARKALAGGRDSK